jgi:BRCA2, oligonucleotide/oligosaccharide-binding, domain 1
LVNNHRSILRKIVERDDTSFRWMVLVISDIITTKSSSSHSAQTTGEASVYLELTDGWYFIETHVLDPPLARLVLKKKLYIGQKINICGAQFTGPEGGMSIWDTQRTMQQKRDMMPSVYLKIQMNQVKRARWYDKLGIVLGGFESKRISSNSLSSLHCLVADGGIVPGIDVIVERLFPLCYFERTETNEVVNYIVRNEKDLAFTESIKQETGQMATPDNQTPVSGSSAAPFCSFLITDFCINTGKHATSRRALFRLWRPELENSVLSDIKEGSRLRIYFCKPSTMKSWTKDLIYLDSCALTRFVTSRRQWKEDLPPGFHRTEIRKREFLNWHDSLSLNSFHSFIYTDIVGVFIRKEVSSPLSSFDSSRCLYENVFLGLPRVGVFVLQIRSNLNSNTLGCDMSPSRVFWRNIKVYLLLNMIESDSRSSGCF